jgi:hypothetical protein
VLAVSSHQAVPSLPDRHLQVFPIVFLRHPIDRAYSAHLFEWKKQAGSEAPKGSFEEYVKEKFAQRRKSAIEEFQTLHLANRGYQGRSPAAARVECRPGPAARRAGEPSHATFKCPPHRICSSRREAISRAAASSLPCGCSRSGRERIPIAAKASRGWRCAASATRNGTMRAGHGGKRSTNSGRTHAGWKAR